MKLNYKRTILVGFAFFLISAFWQAYDKTVPMLMTYKYGMTQTGSGIVMALDNVLAVFLLPLFGALSDKSKSKFGKRTPFILIGTICAVISFIFIPLIGSLWLFIAVLLITLLSMAFFRSPAVALMPDVTCKPLRSKGNAVINLMGTAGGLLILVVGLFIKVGEKHMNNFFPYYLVVCGIMLLGLIVFVLTVKEKKWADEMLDDTQKYFPEESEKINMPEFSSYFLITAKEREWAKRTFKGKGELVVNNKLSKPQLTSLLLILASVALWYMGYNAITSKYSLYADSVLHQSYDLTLMIAQGGAIIAYLPVGFIASKFGRRRTILVGVALLATSFFVAIFMTANSSPIFMYILFAFAGIGWATINVNSFPMVVELAKSGDVGKYTGWYYTASMSAQVLTPILSGAIMDLFGNMSPLFPYASICVALAFLTMFFVRHGDSKPVAKKSALENFDIDD